MRGWIGFVTIAATCSMALGVGPDENDWDVGLRKQQVVAVATRVFARTAISAELRAEREPGPMSSFPAAVIPAGVETIVMTALRKNPGERYGSVTAMAADLRFALQCVGRGAMPARASRP